MQQFKKIAPIEIKRNPELESMQNMLQQNMQKMTNELWEKKEKIIVNACLVKFGAVITLENASLIRMVTYEDESGREYFYYNLPDGVLNGANRFHPDYFVAMFTQVDVYSDVSTDGKISHQIVSKINYMV